MALTASKLQKVSGGVKQVYTYETADDIATVTTSGYFNSVTNNFRQFDVIIVITSTGGTPLIDVIFVTSATGAATVTTSGTKGIDAT